MKRRPKQVTEGRTAAEVLPPLADDNPLLSVVDQIAPHQYAAVSAREFAIGRYSQRRRRPKYALT